MSDNWVRCTGTLTGAHAFDELGYCASCGLTNPEHRGPMTSAAPNPTPSAVPASPRYVKQWCAAGAMNYAGKTHRTRITDIDECIMLVGPLSPDDVVVVMKREVADVHCGDKPLAHWDQEARYVDALRNALRAALAAQPEGETK